MTYRALDDRTVLEYALAQPVLRDLFVDPGSVVAREIGDGNLNLVYALEDDRGGGVIVKQALPYLRVAGESWPLTRDRVLMETRALELYGLQTPDLVPAVLHADPAMSLVAMTYLRHHRVLRAALAAGEAPRTLASAIGTFMATTHFMNSDLHLVGEEKKDRQARFVNPHLCRLQEDFVFTNPFMESDENDASGLPPATAAELRADADLKAAILRTKIEYLTLGQTLLHGDLHTGSVMVAGDDVRVIDPEFAFYGPAAYDVGTFLAHLAIAAAASDAHAPNHEASDARRRYLLAVLADVWSTYRTTSHELWDRGLGGGVAPERFWSGADSAGVARRWLDQYLDDIGRSAARHAGCEVLRRLLGIVTTSELATIDDLGVRHGVEGTLAQLARSWLLGEPNDGIGALHASLAAAFAAPRDPRRTA